jgi:two-component system response regulator HydG
MTSDKPSARVLVVDDRLDMATSVAEGLRAAGFDATPTNDAVDALATIRGDATFDAIVTDLRMPKVDGLQLLDASLEVAPERPVIVMTAYGAIDTAVAAIRRGAYHYLTKPFKVEELVLFLRRALAHRGLQREARALRSALGARRSFPDVVAESEPMAAVLETIARVADTDSPVLLLGETGTGKSLLARAIHDQSARRAGAFVAINCAAIPEALLESELFGHVRGAFTGATTARAGLFVEASEGTLFLDEIGDLAAPLQAKLLHALERGVVRPVGGTREVRVDVRVVSATHADLRARVADGKFRADLLYRLDVVSVEVPPLRQRREDIPALLERFLASARAKYPRSPCERVSSAALAALLRHDWPGNVRELAHLMERLVVLARGVEIGVDDLPATLTPRLPSPSSSAFVVDVPLDLRELQRRYARWAFRAMGEHRGHTAETLGIDYKTLARLLREENEGGD